MRPYPDSPACLSRVPADPVGVAKSGHDAADAGANALQATQDVRNALDGVDYLTRMQVSALLSGYGFLACCREVGVDPTWLTLQRRRALDEQMASHFQRAVDAGGSLAPEAAAATLRGLLIRVGREVRRSERLRGNPT